MVCFKHLNVHAFGDAVFNLVLADIEVIVGNATVLHTLFVIGYVPFPCNIKILFYNPYTAIPATAERQINRIGDIPPFFIFLEPKYIAPSISVRIKGRSRNELF